MNELIIKIIENYQYRKIEPSEVEFYKYLLELSQASRIAELEHSNTRLIEVDLAERDARIAELNMEVDNTRSDSFAEGYKSGYSDGATFEAVLKKRIAELLEGALKNATDTIEDCARRIVAKDARIAELEGELATYKEAEKAEKELSESIAQHARELSGLKLNQ
jgi:flagellar biosynthesis/type III secretory pathway protein FliH